MLFVYAIPEETAIFVLPVLQTISNKLKNKQL